MDLVNIMLTDGISFLHAATLHLVLIQRGSRKYTYQVDGLFIKLELCVAKFYRLKEAEKTRGVPSPA